MARKPDDVPAAGSHHKDPVTKQTDSNRKGGAVASDPHSRPPSGTAQNLHDANENSWHAESENALKSSQDKNPVPADSTRK